MVKSLCPGPRLIVDWRRLANADARSLWCALLCACDTAPTGSLHRQFKEGSDGGDRTASRHRRRATRVCGAHHHHATLDVQPSARSVPLQQEGEVTRWRGSSRQRSATRRTDASHLSRWSLDQGFASCLTTDLRAPLAVPTPGPVRLAPTQGQPPHGLVSLFVEHLR